MLPINQSFNFFSHSAFALALFALALVTGCGSNSQAPPTLDSITLTPGSALVVLATTQQLDATGTLTNGTSGNVTDGVIPADAVWASSDVAVATVDSSGFVSAVGIGVANITLTSDAIVGTAAVTVTAATLQSLSVTPTMPGIAAGTNQNFVAMGTFNDSTTMDMTSIVVWSSSDVGVATISNTVGSEGLATSLIAGTTTLTATSGLISASTDLTVTAATLVSVEVTPTAPSIAAGTMQQFIATGTFTDSTTQDLSTSANWVSSAPTVADISNTAGSEGLVTSATTGTTTITATVNSISATSDLTVTAAVLASIEVTPAMPGVAAGNTQQFMATGIFTDATTQDMTTTATWASSDTGIATINNLGLATSIAVGTSTMSASSGAITGTTDLTVSDALLVSIVVTPVDPSTALGVDQQFTAMGTFTDATIQDLTTSVTWSSSQTAVADISNVAGNKGLASSITMGTTTIAAIEPGTGINASSNFTVSPASLVSIDVTPLNASVALGYQEQFTAMANYTDGSTVDLTTSVTWSSSLPGVATISNANGSEGLATTVTTGSSTMTATDAASGVNSSGNLAVSAAVLVSIAVLPDTPSAALGDTQQFTATGTFSDTDTQDLTTSVTWSSSVPAVATVSNAVGSKGLASSLTAGATTITAIDAATGINNSSVLTVTAASCTDTGGDKIIYVSELNSCLQSSGAQFYNVEWIEVAYGNTSYLDSICQEMGYTSYSGPHGGDQCSAGANMYPSYCSQGWLGAACYNGCGNTNYDGFYCQ